MTLVRRFAVWLSGFVVRRASAGSREWAEGLAREVGVVEGDWKALGWAVGALRVLVDRRAAPIGSLAEVPKAAQRLVENARNGNGLAIVVFLGPMYLGKLYEAKNWSERTGCALVVFGSLVAGINWLMDRRRLKEPWKDNVYDDVVGCARFYRTELGRLVWTQWISMLALCCFGFGTAADLGWLRFHLVLATYLAPIYVLVLTVYLYARRMNQRRVERLDELLGDAE